MDKPEKKPPPTHRYGDLLFNEVTWYVKPTGESPSIKGPLTKPKTDAEEIWLFPYKASDDSEECYELRHDSDYLYHTLDEMEYNLTKIHYTEVKYIPPEERQKYVG